MELFADYLSAVKVQLKVIWSRIFYRMFAITSLSWIHASEFNSFAVLALSLLILKFIKAYSLQGRVLIEISIHKTCTDNCKKTILPTYKVLIFHKNLFDLDLRKPHFQTQNVQTWLNVHCYYNEIYWYDNRSDVQVIISLSMAVVKVCQLADYPL